MNILLCGEFMNPYLKFFNISIPTYGLCICVGVFICAILSMIKSKKNGIDYNDLIVIFAVTIGFGMLGGSLLYILVTYDLKTIFEGVLSGNLCFFQKQGSVFYGGLIFGIMSAIITAKLLKVKIDVLEACVVPYIPLGHAVGRIGCLLGGCCYGFSYNGIFSVTTCLNPAHGPYFPIQCVEVLINLLIMGILLFYSRKKRTGYSILFLYLVIYSFSRFILEFFRGDSIRGEFLLFSTSQWISGIIFILSVFVLLLKNLKRNVEE